MNALHPRYTLPEMDRLWTDEAKFKRWLQVELAFLRARADFGDVDRKSVEAIVSHAEVDVARINQLEQANVHDLLAFVEQVRESLGADAGKYAGLFHTGLTSYDVEDPALMLTMRDALLLAIEAEEKLLETLVLKAKEHQWTLMIARTHGQYAEPTTFGVMLLEFARAVERDIARLELCRHETCVGKLSGAVGVYGDISPSVEEKALGILGLNAQPATQILGRDTHATVLNVLAVAGSTIGRIAHTLWQMTRSDCGELEEPRAIAQKGSSAMAHKKNPIKLEQLWGLPRLLHGYAIAALEDVISLEGRDISQSSVERHIIPGAFALTHYLAVMLEKVIGGLVVHEKAMRENLDVRSYGVWASQRIRNALIYHGLTADEAYQCLQHWAFHAQDTKQTLRQVLETAVIPSNGRTVVEFLGQNLLDSYFDARSYVERGVEHLFDEATLPKKSPIPAGA